MMKSLYRTVPVFSQALLLLVMMGFVSNLIAHDIAFEWLSLPASTLVQTAQIWRLLLYPLSSTSSASIILLCSVLALFAPSVEKMLSTSRLAAYVVSLVIVQGLLYALFLSNSPQNVVLSGGDAISFFILGLFAFLMPRRVLRMHNVFEIRGLFLVFVIALTAFCVSLLTAYKNPSTYFLTGALSSAIGVAFAVLVSTRMQLQLLRFRRYRMEQESVVEDEILRHDVRPHQQFGGSVMTEKTMQSPVVVSIPQTVPEEHLNEILDKILEHGKDSLSDEELAFLQSYAKQP